MIKNQKLDYSVLGDSSTAQMCLVFIHGWSGNKESFGRVAKSFNIKNAAWYLPQAPYLLKQKDSYSWTYETSPGKFEREQPVRMLLDFFDQKIFSKFNIKYYDNFDSWIKNLVGAKQLAIFFRTNSDQNHLVNIPKNSFPLIIINQSLQVFYN